MFLGPASRRIFMKSPPMRRRVVILTPSLWCPGGLDTNQLLSPYRPRLSSRLVLKVRRSLLEFPCWSRWGFGEELLPWWCKQLRRSPVWARRSCTPVFVTMVDVQVTPCIPLPVHQRALRSLLSLLWFISIGSKCWCFRPAPVLEVALPWWVPFRFGLWKSVVW